MTSDSDTSHPPTRSTTASSSPAQSTLIDPACLPRNPPHDFPVLDALPPPSDNPTVCIAIPTSGDPEWETLRCLLPLARHDWISFIGRPFGPYMDMARNELAIEFYRDPALGEWLLFVDDDVAAFTVDDIRAVTTTGHHIVGGAYSSPRDGIEYIVAYNWGEGRHGPHTLIDLTLADLDAMPPEPTHIAAIGTGFLAIHRSVLEAFPHYYDPPQPWFAELTVMPPDASSDITTGVHLGEDLTFCLRANALGIPVHIHPLIRLDHYKKVGIHLPPHPSRLPSSP